jgi:hypothetical protein
MPDYTRHGAEEARDFLHFFRRKAEGLCRMYSLQRSQDQRIRDDLSDIETEVQLKPGIFDINLGSSIKKDLNRSS